MLCSVIAGVYNEFLIKGDGADVHLMVQNVFMYVDSMLCNVILLGFKVGKTSANRSSEGNLKPGGTWIKLFFWFSGRIVGRIHL